MVHSALPRDVVCRRPLESPTDDTGEGMVQAFRRPQSPFESARLRLRGLDPEARYTVRDLDQPQGTQMAGRELTESGLLISIRQRPGAVVITYRRRESND